ncbi:MAG: hypothetical protein GX173_09905 [Ruminococcaceae bacterium]|nr:hypothetical protein [Oscillospiraceae bacterium]
MFFVRSNEQSAFCCNCDYLLEVCGSRRRGYIESSGERIVLVIRRLYCQSCKRIHHELPDLLVPYKRYDRESIESVLEETGQAQEAADDSTISRWRRWFSELEQHIYGGLLAACHRLDKNFAESPDQLSGSLLQRIHHLVGATPGWLGRIVRILVTMNLWVQTRSAFLTG